MWSSCRIKITRNAYAVVVGAAGGATVGIVGWGGGQVIIPSMTYPNPAFANFSQLAATGFSLSTLSVSGLSSSYSFWRDERVNVPIAMAIGIPAVVASRAGSHLAKKLSGEALELVFNCFTIVSIPAHFWIQKRAALRHANNQQEQEQHPSKLLSKEADSDPTSDSTSDSKKGIQMVKAKDDGGPLAMTMTVIPQNNFPLMQHVSCGVISGTISALIGVGGLPITMSYLTEATDLPHHYVQGTAVCALIPSIVVSTVSIMNVMPLATASCVAMGGVVGGYGGAKVALSLSEDQLRYVYMGSLLLFGGRSSVAAVRNIRRIWGRGSKHMQNL